MTTSPAPTVHQAAVKLAEEKRKADPKLSLAEAFEAIQEPFQQRHGIRYHAKYRTFLTHFYNNEL